MGIDWSKLGKKRDEAKEAAKAGSIWKFEVGETKAFIHGPCYPNDDFETTAGLNFVEVWTHYVGGGKKGGHICLDPGMNPVILHPIVAQFLSEKKKNAFRVSSKTRCPTCEGIRAGNIPAEQGAQKKWLVGLTPMFYRHDSESQWIARKFEPKVHIAGNQIYNGIASAMIELSAYRDITDPNTVTLVKITREGESFGNTNYDGKADIDTTMKPLQLNKGQRRVLDEAMKPGGSCDLFKVLANLMKSPEQIRSTGKGIETDEDVGGGDGVDRKECYGIDYADDDECAACPDNEECRECCAACDSGEDKEAENEGGNTQDEYDEPPESEAPEPPEGSEEYPLPECFGSWERSSPDCLACDVANECESETRPAAPPQKPVSLPKRPPAPPPKSAASTQAKPAPKSSSGKAPESGEDDPDLEAIEAEGRKIAGRRGKAPVVRR